MQMLRRISAVGCLGLVIAALAAVMPAGHHPRLGTLGNGSADSVALRQESLRDLAAPVVENVAPDFVSVRSWERSKHNGPSLGLGVATYVALAAAAAFLILLVRSSRDSLLALTVIANGVRAPPAIRH